MTALWPLVALRGATLVVTDEKQLSMDPGNDYVSENLRYYRVIFDSAVSVPWELAEAAVCETLSLPGGRGHATRRPAALRPLLPGLAAAAVRLLDLSPTSEALDEGRWLDPRIEDTLFAEAGRDAGIVIARYGEHRLTRAAVDSAHEPATCALHAEVQLPADGEVIAPAPARRPRQTRPGSRSSAATRRSGWVGSQPRSGSATGSQRATSSAGSEPHRGG